MGGIGLVGGTGLVGGIGSGPGRWAVLLRGVNIGGVRIGMKELAAALGAAGFDGVRTVLASGNVLLTSEDDAATVAARVSATIRQRFGHDIVALAVPLEVVRRAVDRYPFRRSADRHSYVVFGAAPEVAEELLAAAGELDPAVEQVQLDEGLLYWDAPKGETLTTAFGRHYGKRQASGVATTRNLNTLEKLLAVG